MSNRTKWVVRVIAVIAIAIATPTVVAQAASSNGTDVCYCRAAAGFTCCLNGNCLSNYELYCPE
jgi:hypothetical protein